jgi:hypothetical protein
VLSLHYSAHYYPHGGFTRSRKAYRHPCIGAVSGRTEVQSAAGGRGSLEYSGLKEDAVWRGRYGYPSDHELPGKSSQVLNGNSSGGQLRKPAAHAGLVVINRMACKIWEPSLPPRRISAVSPLHTWERALASDWLIHRMCLRCPTEFSSSGEYLWAMRMATLTKRFRISRWRWTKASLGSSSPPTPMALAPARM